MSIIGRPEREETIDYYHPYIDLVPDGDIRQILDDQRHQTIAFLQTIPESLADHRHAPDKWSVREIVSHINDCERLYTMRAFWFARAMESSLPSFDSDRCVQTANSPGRALVSYIDEFHAIRASTLELFRHLSDEAWMRRGTASDYPFSVRAMAYIAAGHVTHHTGILKERYL